MDHRFFHQGEEWWLLNLPTLHLCREFLSQIQLFKFIKGDSATNVDNNIIICPDRKSRNYHQYKLYKPFSRTSNLSNSFVQCTD